MPYFHCQTCQAKVKLDPKARFCPLCGKPFESVFSANVVMQHKTNIPSHIRLGAEIARIVYGTFPVDTYEVKVNVGLKTVHIELIPPQKPAVTTFKPPEKPAVEIVKITGSADNIANQLRRDEEARRMAMRER